MVKKKILITGGSGYLGSRLSFFLSQNGFEIIPLCNSQIPNNKEWVESMYAILQGDLRDKTTLNKIELVKPDVIIHLVSLDHHKSGVNIQETLQINVQTTWELLTLSTRLKVEKFIYFSTTQVYGNELDKFVTETTKLSPNNDYALTHMISENIVSFFNRVNAINGITLRLSNSYGEPIFANEKSWSLVLNDLCKAAFYHKKIILKSNGKIIKNFIHYSTINHVVCELLKTKDNLSGIYNLCYSEMISLLDAAFIIREVYYEMYGVLLDVFINKTEKIEKYEQIINIIGIGFSNNKLTQHIQFDELPLKYGIKKIFEDLEKK